MSTVYKILDGTIMKCRKRFPPMADETLKVADLADVTDIAYRMDGDAIYVLLCDESGKVIFEIERDVLYPPGPKMMKASKFHREFYEHFLVPVATDKVFTTVDLGQLAPRTGSVEHVVKSAS